MMLRFAFGILMGIFFYGGLWLTVRHLATTRHPFTLSLGSLLLRMGVTLAGFFIVIGSHWQNAAASLLGFTAARLFLWGGSPRTRSSLTESASYKQRKPTWASAADRGGHPTINPDRSTPCI